jgi:hypothetical protein
VKEAVPEPHVPYLHIDKVFNELRDELLSAMHSAVNAEVRGTRVDVARLYRSFTRAAAKGMANPVQVSDKCLGESTARARKGAKPREDD